MATSSASKRPRIAVLASGSASGEKGGAERFFEGLRDALDLAGAEADLHWVTSDESSFDQIQRSYLRFYEYDLSNYDGVVSTKAPSYLVRHRNHVCYLVHTMRVFYDMFDVEFPQAGCDLIEQRRFIHRLDSAALQTPRTKKILTIGHEVKERLEKYNNLTADVIYPSSTLQGYRCGGQKYFFIPGRLHRWKRVDLAIKAMQYLLGDMELLISGTGEDEARFRALAGSDQRIRFIGRVTDEEMLNLYADALGVLFVPVREDLGFITFEAFHSSKPVITCEDSGEPARLVRHNVSGYIVKPNAEAIAHAMHDLQSNMERAGMMGRAGYESVRNIGWANVASALIEMLGYQKRHSTAETAA
jgi:glycosyltransferase involved in cell wall biosynthesis